MMRDASTCQYCGSAATTLDHVMPVSRGGAWSFSNLVAACSRCNAKKGARTPAGASCAVGALSSSYSRLAFRGGHAAIQNTKGAIRKGCSDCQNRPAADELARNARTMDELPHMTSALRTTAHAARPGSHPAPVHFHAILCKLQYYAYSLHFY